MATKAEGETRKKPAKAQNETEQPRQRPRRARRGEFVSTLDFRRELKLGKSLWNRLKGDGMPVVPLGGCHFVDSATTNTVEDLERIERQAQRVAEDVMCRVTLALVRRGINLTVGDRMSCVPDITGVIERVIITRGTSHDFPRKEPILHARWHATGS